VKKISTVTAKQSRNFSEPKLTIGLDLGDGSSCLSVGAFALRIHDSVVGADAMFRQGCPEITPASLAGFVPIPQIQPFPTSAKISTFT